MPIARDGLEPHVASSLEGVDLEKLVERLHQSWLGPHDEASFHAPLRASPTGTLVHRFAREAVARALLAGTVGALASCGGGCSARPSPDASSLRSAHDPASPQVDPAAAPPAPPSSALAPLGPVDATALSPTAAVSFASGGTPRAFPCAERPWSVAEAQALHAQGDAAYELALRVRDARELDHRARALRLPFEVDYVTIRRARLSSGIRFEDGRLPVFDDTHAEAGRPCGGAHDPAACSTALVAAREALFEGLRCDPQGTCSELDFTYALVTRGDAVRAYKGKRELSSLFGAVDSPVEAWALLAAERKVERYTCDEPGRASHALFPEGYVLASRQFVSRCRPLRESGLTFRVDAQGRVKRLGERVLSNEPETCMVSGRRPTGFVPHAPTREASAASLFVRMAELEWASVRAFEQLEAELAELGAAEALLERVRRARRDEVRHTQLVRTLSGDRAVRAPSTRGVGPSTPFALARENAQEGCVRELYGALVARFQAERAQDPAVRAVFRELADDEAEHAALAWDVAAFLAPLLTPAERAQLEEARADALLALWRELVEPGDEARTRAGLPTVLEAGRLLDAMGPVVSPRSCMV